MIQFEVSIRKKGKLVEKPVARYGASSSDTPAWEIRVGGLILGVAFEALISPRSLHDALRGMVVETARHRLIKS